MNPVTPRFGLPLLAMGQAQKDVTHNEALLLLDLLLGSEVESRMAAPPAQAPREGQTWLVGEDASGAWDGRSDTLAAWTAGGWRFIAPADGYAVRIRDTGRRVRWTGSAWVEEPPFETSGTALEPPGGAATVDAEARAAIVQLQTLLRSLGFVT
ncbi:MAG: DUF2793 domain-containing protein [Thermaurantiacus sp.]